MKRKFLEVVKLGDAILLGDDLSDGTEQAFFSAANAFLRKYRARYFCNEIEYYIERVNKKIVFNA